MAGIRVISGTAKGRKLKLVPGDSTRPVMDRVKQAVFNIIGPGIEGASFLDLFGGTGGVGIEALSRGAASAMFIDKDRYAVRTIEENLRTAGVTERGQVLRGDALDYLRSKPFKGFDYIYIAPPQYLGLWGQCINLLDNQPDWLNPDGWAVAQMHPREFSAHALTNLTLVDERKYGSTLICIYERPGK